MSIQYTIFYEKPECFNIALEVSGCYCSWNDKILFVKRHPHKPQGNTWGIPGGKIEIGESPKMAVIREIDEEIGLNINDDSLEMIGSIYCRLPNIDYVFHIFLKRFQTLPTINLLFDESIEFRWVTVEEVLELPLIIGGVEALNYYLSYAKYNCSNTTYNCGQRM